MGLLPFDSLPAHRPRRFVGRDVDLGEWTQVSPLFDQLEQRAAKCATAPTEIGAEAELEPPARFGEEGGVLPPPQPVTAASRIVSVGTGSVTPLASGSWAA